jgi:RNA polymerase sigma-70 factor, ECF subfamily
MSDPAADRVLVDKARAGDRRALDDLLRGQYDRIFGVCRRITGSEADAADAAQEAMMSIVKYLDRYDGTAAFSTWVYRIATNASLDELRRRGRRPLPVEEITERVSAGASDAPSHIADRLAVDAALAKLPVDYRVAVTLRDLCDLDYAEIAIVLGIPIGTVRSRIARARLALGPLLRPVPDDTAISPDETERDGNSGPSSGRPTSNPQQKLSS